MKQDSLYMDQLLAQFLPQGSWSVHVGSSGMNNTTRFVETNEGRYVLRIYETHQDNSKVHYEHSALLTLKDKFLPFYTPEPVRAQSGDTIVRASDGKIAGLFRFIEGVNPSFHESGQLKSFGLAAGQLTSALEKVQISQPPVYRPYYEIENTHPNCSLEDAIRFCANPPDKFTQYSASLMQIGEQLASFMDSIPMLKQLPHQLIHGDLNASNILVDTEGRISAILDFEFITEDLRVMELCVCLSDLIRAGERESSLWANVEAFLTGYGMSIKLVPGEIAVIPLLILLRRLDVFIHFLGRYFDGINKIEVVAEQINNIVNQIQWLSINEDKLLALSLHHLSI